jgi:hypothetical protein
MDKFLNDYFAGGLVATVPAMQMASFRVAIAVAALWKFCHEGFLGAWRWFDDDSFLRYQYEASGPRPRIGRRGYHTLYLMKFVAACMLLFGVLPQAAGLALAVWFFFELTYENKYTTSYLGLCSILMVLSPGSGDCLSWHTLVCAFQNGLGGTLRYEFSLRVDAFPQVLGVALTVSLYLNTAYQKIRSRSFISGTVLHRWTEHMYLSTKHVRGREVWYPKWIVRLLITGDPAAMARRWRPAAWTTIGLETVLPFGLIYGPTWKLFAVIGLLMHLAFTAIYPRRLFSFSVAAVGSYALFVPGFVQ